MTPRISVILPTTGRETLKAARESCVGADEVIVIEDHTGDRGYRARAEGMASATGTHLAFLDDDDAYLPGAIEAMRDHATDRPVIFRMDDPFHGVIWRDPELRYGNVGTPMFLVPNDPDRLGTFEPVEFGRGAGRGGDFHFISGCVERMGGPVWREDIVCRVRPHERGPSVTIVTPWHNHPEFAEDYWAAMNAAHTNPLVIDNGSVPPIPDAVRLDRNEGFSHACNVGLGLCETDAVLFLNNDIRATSRGWLEKLTKAMEPGVLVGAELRYDPHGAVGQPMPYLDGWCVGGMTEDISDIGGWDEGYMEPSYYGDNDLSLRARAAGMTLREVRCGLVHKLNGTAKDMDVTAATLANRERFHRAALDLLGVAA